MAVQDPNGHVGPQMATQDPRFLLTELINTLHYRGVVEHFTKGFASSLASSQLEKKENIWSGSSTKWGL